LVLDAGAIGLLWQCRAGGLGYRAGSGDRRKGRRHRLVSGYLRPFRGVKALRCVAAAKRLYDETWVSDDAAAALIRESELQFGLIGNPNQIAAVVAGMSGEQPVFVDPA
jgi:hypothetical protein